MNVPRFGFDTLLGATPFAVALIYAGTVLRSNGIAVSSALSYLNYPLIALVAIGAVFITLQRVGNLVPGGPSRRAGQGPH